MNDESQFNYRCTFIYPELSISIETDTSRRDKSWFNGDTNAPAIKHPIEKVVKVMKSPPVLIGSSRMLVVVFHPFNT